MKILSVLKNCCNSVETLNLKYWKHTTKQMSLPFSKSESNLQSVSVMKLSVLMLAFIVGFVSPSVFHEDGTRWNPQSYPIVNKKVHNMQTVHLVQKRKKARGKSFENFEVTGNNESFWSSMSLLFAKTPTSAKLKYPKNKLSMVRPQWTDETDNNTGRVIVCGPEGAYFNISWRPKVIDPYKCVRIYFDIISPIYFDKGQGRVDVYLEGSSYPMYSVVRLVSCDFFQNIDPLVRCPLKKGVSIRFATQYSELYNLPVGSYTIVLNIISFNVHPPPLFVCVNFTLHIATP